MPLNEALVLTGMQTTIVANHALATSCFYSGIVCSSLNQTAWTSLRMPLLRHKMLVSWAQQRLCKELLFLHGQTHTTLAGIFAVWHSNHGQSTLVWGALLQGHITVTTQTLPLQAR